MQYLAHFVDLFLHLDKHLVDITQSFGVWTYVILFLIVFCETGLVVTPFLPGDSLLFAAGALSAQVDPNLSSNVLNPFSLFILLFIAAILGDALNYSIGRWLKDKVFDPKYKKIFKPEYLQKTNSFYEKYGGKTIIIARFVPIVRTFAPFLAGVGSMNYTKFAIYNVVGGFLWVSLFIGAGYFFGNVPVVKKNFTLVILAIIVLSIMPAIIEIVRAKLAAPKKA